VTIYDHIPDPNVRREAGLFEPEPATQSDIDSADAGALAKRRLALKLAANAGISIALAELLVVIALGNGRTP